MIRYIYQKIKNQKWLSVCMVLGISLLIAIICCHPMFQNGCQNKLIQQMFVKYIEDYNKYPTIISQNGTFENGTYSSVEELDQYFQDNRDIWQQVLPNWDVVAKQNKYYIKNEYGTNYYYGKSNGMEIAYIPELEDHITYLKGESYNVELKPGEFGCIAPESSMDRNNLVIGEKLVFENFYDENRNPLVLVVTGFFKESDSRDLFWYEAPNADKKAIYVNQETFDYILQNLNYSIYGYDCAVLLDYTKIQNDLIDGYIHSMREIPRYDETFRCSFTNILSQFEEKRKQINVMLWVLELPIIGMMFAFLYMVSNQIVITGRGEIATLKSRGFLKRHIFVMYLLEYTMLAVIAFIFGVPGGYLLCKIAAKTTDFMTFEGLDYGRYPFISVAFLYGLAAFIVAIIFILIPVIGQSHMSIVEFKSSNHLYKKMFWEKSFLDVIFLLLSLYFLYNFNKTIDQIRTRALSGNKIDPFIFVNICLFMVSAGFFIFRLMHYFVQGVYRVGKKKWKPVAYAAFLQITRSFQKQTFISVFMILTVSFGLFNANVARTINRNYEDRITYENGVDVVIQEKWSIKNYIENGTIKYRYVEPDELKYQELISKGYCDMVTKVKNFNSLRIKTKDQTITNCRILGIDTKTFGEATSLKEELYGDTHWYHYLNALSKEKNGVILSKNAADSLKVSVGDSVKIYEEIEYKERNSSVECKVVAVVDAWPSYKNFEYYDGKEFESYLAVVNFPSIMENFEMSPYHMWLKVKDDVTDQQLYDYLTKEMGIKIISYKSTAKDISEMKQSPEIQIVNGMFTLSFLIALVLCGVGFLIYWLISIKQRELLLGSYRAMGLSVRSVNRMLIYEHIFSTFLSIISGGLVGMSATLLFIRLFGVVYLPEKSVLDIYTYYEMGDIIKLFATVCAMILLCLFIIRRQIKKMNITQALKLGED